MTRGDVKGGKHLSKKKWRVMAGLWILQKYKSPRKAVGGGKGAQKLGTEIERYGGWQKVEAAIGTHH